MINFGYIKDIKDINLLSISDIPSSYHLKYALKICYVGNDELRLIEDSPKVHISPQQIASKGGEWLGTIRNWIQCRCQNGEQVTWGSQDQLIPRSLTVMDLEHLASRIASAAVNEYINKKDLQEYEVKPETIVISGLNHESPLGEITLTTIKNRSIRKSIPVIVDVEASCDLELVKRVKDSLMKGDQ